MNDDERIAAEKALEAAEFLLADVRNRRADLDRRERELAGIIAEQRAKLGRVGMTIDANAEQAKPKLPVDDEQQEEYGAISRSIIEVMKERGRKMTAPEVAEALERRGVQVRAKSYYLAARSAMRSLAKRGSIRRVAQGYYRVT